MALYGYIPKTRPAPWTTVPGAVKSKKVKPQPIGSWNGLKRSAMAPRTRFVRRKPQTHKAWPKHIATVSKGKVKGLAAYRKRARAFVREAIRNGKTCPIFAKFDELPVVAQEFLTQPWDGQRRSCKLNEIHHTHGKLAANLSYEPWWLVTSRWGHRLIHAMPALARYHKWICPEGQWNKQPPQNEL
jgi:hypothetical protein